MKISHLKFLTDENIDEAVLIFLRREGFDVFDIKEQRLFGMLDEDILTFAFKENRVVISQDSDFGTLIFKHNFDFYGVMYLRPGHEDASFHINTLTDIINADIDFSIPFILVAENLIHAVKIRYRPLS